MIRRYGIRTRSKIGVDGEEDSGRSLENQRVGPQNLRSPRVWRATWGCGRRAARETRHGRMPATITSLVRVAVKLSLARAHQPHIRRFVYMGRQQTLGRASATATFLSVDTPHRKVLRHAQVNQSCSTATVEAGGDVGQEQKTQSGDRGG